MILERAKNTKRNALFGFLNQAVVVLLPFIVRTLLIKELGIEYVGLSGLFSSILSILSLTELGFDSAVVIILYGAIAKDDKRQINALMAFIKRTYFIVGIIILCLGLCCMPFLKYLVKDASTLPADINLYYIYLVFLAGTVISYFFGGYRHSLVIGFQRNDIVSKISLGTQIVIFALQVFILVNFRNYYYYIFTIPLLSLAKNLLLVFFSKRIFTEVKAEGRINDEEKKEIKKLVTGSFLNMVGARMSISLDNIVISSFLGVVILGYYSNYYYIANSVITLLFLTYTSMQGGLGNAVNTDSVEKNRSDMNKLHFIYNWMLGWFCFTMFFLFQPFMCLWLGKEGMLPNFIVVLLCLFVYQSECFGIVGTYKTALGIVWEDRFRPIVAGLFNFTVNILLVLWLKRYGEEYALIGIILSTILSYALINCPWFVSLVFKKYYKTGLKECYITTYKYFIVVILCALVCLPLFNLLPITRGIDGWKFFTIRILLCIVVPNGLFWLVYHRSNTYKEAKEFLLARVKL